MTPSVYLLLEPGSRKQVIFSPRHMGGERHSRSLSDGSTNGLSEIKDGKWGRRSVNKSKWANGSVGSGLVESDSCDSGPVKIAFAAGAGVPGFGLVDATDSARAESG